MFATAAFFALAGSALAIPLHANSTLEKRVFNDARFTWYDTDAGYGSCGTWNQDSDMVSITNNAALDFTEASCTFRWLP